MPQAIDDFTIDLPELTDMAACELKVRDGLDRLWRMFRTNSLQTQIYSLTAWSLMDLECNCLVLLCHKIAQG